MVFLFLLIVIFFFVMFFINDRKQKQRNSKLEVRRDLYQNSNQVPQRPQEETRQEQEKISLGYCPDYSTINKCMNIAWTQRGMDEAIDSGELDEYQRSFAIETNRVIRNALSSFVYQITSNKSSIQDNTEIDKIAEKCLKAQQIPDYMYPYVLALFKGVVEECVRECLREKIREEASSGNEKAKEEARLITKDESTKSEINELAKTEFSERDYDLYQRTVKNLYKKIPYSYYGIYMAVKIRAKAKDLRTKEEQDYLNTYIEYYDTAAESLNPTYH